MHEWMDAWLLPQALVCSAKFLWRLDQVIEADVR
jgi:hypothetical protein